MRLVLDTNIVVSALIWGGTPFKLLQIAIGQDISLYTSPALLTELREVLAREHLSRRLRQQQTSVDEAIRLYDELTISVTPLATYPEPCPTTSTIIRSSPPPWPPGRS